MKHKGFTLAEILISLGIIGVISALSLPTFITSTQNQTNAARLSSTILELSKAFGQMMLDDDADSFEETSYGSDLDNTRFANYINYTRVSDTLENLLSSENNTYETVNSNGEAEETTDQETLSYLLENGAAVQVEKSEPHNDHFWGNIYIDVNGKTTPNRFGRDIFALTLGQDGRLYPFGSSRQNEIVNGVANVDWSNSEEPLVDCNNGNGNGLGCTARLMENGYKVDY